MTRSGERRREARARFEGWVEISLSGRRQRARGLDLSRRGIGISLRPPHPPAGQLLLSEFALPGISLPLALEGVVAWSDAEGSRLGLRFRSVDPGLDELIERFVTERLT